MNAKYYFYLYSKGSLSIIRSCGTRDFLRFISDYLRIKKILKEKIAAIAAKHAVQNPGVSFQKYLDVSYWLFENMHRCYALGLHRENKKLSILDIGTGAGYFPFVCRFYGHDVEALDVPDNEMYNEIISTLEIKRHDQRIASYSDLEAPGKYDLITAYMLCFNNHKMPNLWHISEWSYFLGSLYKNHLNAAGKVFLSFNAESAAEPISKELLAYFSRNNATIDGNTVYCRSDYLFNQ